MGDCADNTISGNLGFIGAGNMAWAIGERLVKSGAISPSQIYVSAPSERSIWRWMTLGTNTSHNNGSVIDNCSVIFLAMKPNMLTAALEGVESTVCKPISNKLFVSILAGVNLSTLENKINCIGTSCRVVRVMPNTPIMVGVGASVFCGGDTATSDDLQLVKKILSVGSLCEQVPETFVDALGGLAGSGPAYVYMMIEALSDGGVKMGIPRATATKFAAQMVMGAAKMVLETNKHPGQLKDEVCSPGGTTIAGVHALERGGFRSAVIDAVEAATNRSKELGSANSSARV